MFLRGETFIDEVHFSLVTSEFYSCRNYCVDFIGIQEVNNIHIFMSDIVGRR
jgi:hypothetical protein